MRLTGLSKFLILIIVLGALVAEVAVVVGAVGGVPGPRPVDRRLDDLGEPGGEAVDQQQGDEHERAASRVV